MPKDVGLANIRVRRIAKGQCANCPRLRRTGGNSRFCSFCLTTIYNATNSLRAKRKAAGRCTRCGGARDDLPHSLCQACGELQKKYMKKHRENKGA